MRDKMGEAARIEHMLQAIGFIKEFTAGADEQHMHSNPMMRFAVERQLEIIGEASNFLHPESKEEMPEIPWEKIKGFRNISVHEYFEIDPAIIWRTVIKHIPPLEAALARLKNKQNNTA